MTRFVIPAQSVPPMDGAGFSGPWRQFLELLWRRTGGPGDVTINANNLTITPTSNTNLRITYVGTDGTSRKVDLTLS